MAHLPNRSNHPLPLQVQRLSANYDHISQVREQQRIPTQSIKSSHPQNFNYPLQKPIPPKLIKNDVSNYLSMESSEFKSISSNVKSIQHHHIPSSKTNQMNQTMNVPKTPNTNINSSLINKQLNQSMTLQKQDANKSKSQSFHSFTNQTINNLSSIQIHSRPTVQFHPSYFLLSKFPQLIPKDQIYMSVINRLENHQTKYCFHQLYINLKFLLIQSDEQFWKYLSHLHLTSMNGLSDEQVRDGYKLRLALESCLTNFSIKQFNKCVNSDELKSSSVAVSKRIYKYENIFNSSSFRSYDKLFQSVLEFFQRIVKTRNPFQINIIVSSWYMDTLKILQLATIYGSKEPSRVKQLIKNMFNLNPKVYTQDFVTFIRKLHQYIQNSASSDDNKEAYSLLQHLNKKLQAVPHKYKHKSNFHNPQKYFARQIFFVCSDCLKLFIYVTNIFKFFPSRLKLIFMQNTDFIRVIIKISVRVIYNLRVEQAQKKRWKVSSKIRLLLKDLQFMLLEKITEMYKFIFLNTKNALQQQIFDCDQQEQRTIEEIKQQKIILRFYKKLIEGTVNRKKDPQKDKNIISYLNQQGQNSQTHRSQLVDALITQDEQSLSDNNHNESVNLKQQKGQETQNKKQQTIKSQKKENCDTTKNEKKQQKSRNKEKILQNEYGRVLIKHLLRKQLKKDSNKYSQNPYFYTKKLYSYFKDKIKNDNKKSRTQTQRQQNSQEQKSIDSIQRGFFKYLLVLQEFETQVKQQYKREIQLNDKFRRVDLIMRQLPSLKQFKKRQQRIQYEQLMRILKLSNNKEYEDEPTQQQEIQMEWNQRLLDEDDFTRIEQGMFSNQSVIQFYMPQKQQQQINEPIGSNVSFTQITGINKTQVEEWTVIGRRNNQNLREINNNRSKYKAKNLEGDSSQQLSPQQITDSQIFTQQILSASMMLDPNSNNSLNTTKQPSILNMNNPIFKPHQSLKKLSYSMIKQQLQYFNKIKNLNWHQISRISIKNNKQKHNSSQDQLLMKFDKMIKVEDIGLSFDMILGDSDQEQEQQNGKNNFSYFYYNQWKHQSTRHKKKSFMEDYSWTQVNQTQQQNNEFKQQKHNIQKNDIKNTQKFSTNFNKKNKQIEVQQQSVRFKKKYVQKSRMEDNMEEQQQQFVRRDYANYMSTNQNYLLKVSNNNKNQLNLSGYDGNGLISAYQGKVGGNYQYPLVGHQYNTNDIIKNTPYPQPYPQQQYLQPYPQQQYPQLYPQQPPPPNYNPSSSYSSYNPLHHSSSRK